ncbi:MAG: DUF2170 family protein [Pseudomonadota bacterium]
MQKSVKEIAADLLEVSFFDDYSVSHSIHENSLIFTFHEYGDLPVILVVSNKQVLVEVALVERHEFDEPEKIDYQLLTTHKYLPLSAIAIEKINGIDWYVMFGALSIHSKTSVLVEELNELVANTFEVIDALEPLYKFNQQ